MEQDDQAKPTKQSLPEQKPETEIHPESDVGRLAVLFKQVMDEYVGGNALKGLLDCDVWPEAEFARLMRKDRRTLRRWHRLRTGPPRIVIGREIFYRREAVMQWLLGREEKMPQRGTRRSRRVS